MSKKTKNSLPISSNSKDEITVKIQTSNRGSYKKINYFTSRSFKYGSVSTILTAVFITVVIAANIVLYLLSTAFSWSIDMTSNQIYKVSDAARQIVAALDENAKIEITVLYPEDEYPQIFAEPLRRFANLSDNITYRFVDPDKNPGIVSAYQETYNIEAGAIILESGSRTRVFNAGEYYSYDEDAQIYTYSLEERLSAGALYVTKSEVPVVYIITDHGELGYDALSTNIANNGAEVKTISLRQISEFDSKSRVMIIANPTSDFSESEIRKLEDFLSNDSKLGRSVMYFSAPGSVPMPNLEKFLRSWGIEYNDDRILESVENSIENIQTAFYASYTEAEIAGTVIKAERKPIIPNAKSINLLFEQEGAIETKALLTTSADSYSKATGNIITSLEKTDEDKSGPFDVSVMATKTRYIDNIASYSHVMANGSHYMLESGSLNDSGTGEFLHKAYKVMVDETDDTIVGAIKQTTSTKTNYTSADQNRMMAIVIFAVPGVFLVLGMIVFIKRRFL